MFRRSRLKSKASTLVLSCKLLILLMIAVSAMNAATNYLNHWLDMRNGRPTGTGIISAGRPHHPLWPTPTLIPDHHKLHPFTRTRLVNVQGQHKDRSRIGTGAHELFRYQANYMLDIVAKLWQSTLKSPIIVAHAIRLIRIEAPSSVEMGSSIKLRCLYEVLRGEKLQSLAWYKNGREFYRYQPFERRQPILTFSLGGINVDMSRSKNSTVYLTNTTMETTGRYKCEVTSTTFREANQEAYVRVTESKSSGVPRMTDLINWILPYLTAISLAEITRRNQEIGRFSTR